MIKWLKIFFALLLFAGKLTSADVIQNVAKYAELSDKLDFLKRYIEFHELYESGRFAVAGKLLVQILTVNPAPKNFWPTVLVDVIPLLEGLWKILLCLSVCLFVFLVGWWLLLLCFSSLLFSVPFFLFPSFFCSFCLPQLKRSFLMRMIPTSWCGVWRRCLCHTARRICFGERMRVILKWREWRWCET